MTCYCEKCKKTMDDKNFYTSNNLERYPNFGKLTQCKNCMTMHVDNWRPETYLWILEEIDVPYIPDEWNRLMLKYANDAAKITGTTILGRYLAKMKLVQWKKYRYKDSEFLQELAKAKIEQTMQMQGYDAQEITKVINEAHVPIPEKPAGVALATEELDSGWGAPAEDDNFQEELTDEDKTYLRLKWGKTYRPVEWVQLEQLYDEMMQSYDIQAAGDINTLKIACKCSLKANQLLDLGDIDGAQKATKMYDSLMKSGKWTAAQNKTAEDEVVDSIGELVALCEKEGFIPRYYKTAPQDHIDRVIEDLQKYTHDLITNETGLESMLETQLKKIEEEKETIKQAAESALTQEEEEEAKLFDYDNGGLLETEDYSDFKDFQMDLEEADQEFFDSLNQDDFNEEDE